MEFRRLPGRSTGAPARKIPPASADLATGPRPLSPGEGLWLAQPQANLLRAASAPPRSQGRNQSTSIQSTTASANSSSTDSQRPSQMVFHEAFASVSGFSNMSTASSPNTSEGAADLAGTICQSRSASHKAARSTHLHPGVRLSRSIGRWKKELHSRAAPVKKNSLTRAE